MGTVSGLPFAQGREGGSGCLVRGGVGKEKSHTFIPKVVRPVRAELMGSFLVCKKASWVRRLPHIPHAYGLISHQDKILGRHFLP